LGAAFNDPSVDKIHPCKYDWLGDHYKVLASYAGLLPNQFQAVCWLSYKEMKNDK
jgi:hypothetical protein